MSILDLLRKIFGLKPKEEEVKSINQSLNQSITEKPKEPLISEYVPEPYEPSSTIELQKESLQLGVAAGYTGRAIREIEASLARIESQMVTKDWFIIQFKENIEKRLETIQNSLDTLLSLVQKVPEPIKTELTTRIQTLQKELTLTPKMQELVQAVKDKREISYTDLAQLLNITEDALRGLLSITVKRASQLGIIIERFERNGRGWVRHIDKSTTPTDSNQSQINHNQSSNSV